MNVNIEELDARMGKGRSVTGMGGMVDAEYCSRIRPV